jgi:hypothetical protein
MRGEALIALILLAAVVVTIGWALFVAWLDNSLMDAEIAASEARLAEMQDLDR